MTLLSPPFALGAAGQVLSGKTLRLAGGAAFRNAAAGVQGISGVLYGPAGTMGELTLNSNTSLTVNPFRAVVQQTQDNTQGQYLVANDAAATFTTATSPVAMPVQDATQFRRAYVAVYVADSQVAGVGSTSTTDRAVLDILAGPLAATAGAAAYPAVPPNALLLGELLIPPTGQAVTMTPYNIRTTGRGGILPVIVDGSANSGHDGALPLHDGQARWHPTYGLQVGVGGAWGSPIGAPARTTVPLSGAWVGGTGSYTEIPQVWKVSADEVRFSGIMSLAAGYGTGAVALGIIPAGFRPPGDLVRIAMTGNSSTNGTAQRVNIVAATGAVNLISTAAIAASAFVSIDCGWRLS
jgi:hypothetical protein